MLLTKVENIDWKQMTFDYHCTTSENPRHCPHGLAAIILPSINILRTASLVIHGKAAIFEQINSAKFRKLVEIGLKVIDQIKFSGSFLIKYFFLMFNEEWSSTDTYTLTMKLTYLGFVKWAALEHKTTPANKTYLAQFLLNIDAAGMAIPIFRRCHRIRIRVTDISLDLAERIEVVGGCQYSEGTRHLWTRVPGPPDSHICVLFAEQGLLHVWTNGPL